MLGRVGKFCVRPWNVGLVRLVYQCLDNETGRIWFGTICKFCVRPRPRIHKETENEDQAEDQTYKLQLHVLDKISGKINEFLPYFQEGEI